MSAFVISLDFELFWGGAGLRTMADLGERGDGVRQALPRLLELFRSREIGATWATVGMLMCADHREWNATRPRLLPGYQDQRLSTYRLGEVAKAYPQLFFAPDLVRRIADTPGQEVATHTYSHFYCGEPGATPGQLAADLDCAIALGRRLQLNFRSIVFPRNQIAPACLDVLAPRGITAYRGNPDHWLYRRGHAAVGGLAGRAVRLADSWLPISRAAAGSTTVQAGLVNVPASALFRPWSRRGAALQALKIARITRAMRAAARSGQDFHLWWHPHDYGVDTDRNLAALRAVLDQYRLLRDQYGMQSQTMAQVAAGAFASERPDLGDAPLRSVASSPKRR